MSIGCTSYAHVELGWWVFCIGQPLRRGSCARALYRAPTPDVMKIRCVSEFGFPESAAEKYMLAFQLFLTHWVECNPSTSVKNGLLSPQNADISAPRQGSIGPNLGLHPLFCQIRFADFHVSCFKVGRCLLSPKQLPKPKSFIFSHWHRTPY